MIYILLTLGIVIVFVSQRYLPEKYQFINVVLPVWTIWTLLSRLRLYGLFRPSMDSACFIYSNIVVLCMGFILTCKISIRRKNRINTDEGSPWYDKNQLAIIDEYSKSKIVNSLRIVCFILELGIFLIEYYRIYTGQINADMIRTLIFSEDRYQIFGNQFIYLLYTYFCRGFFMFDIIEQFIMLRTKGTKPRVISLLNLFLYCMISLSRIEIMRVAVFMLLTLAFVEGNHHIHISARVKKWIRRSLILIVVLIVSLGILRGSNPTNIVFSSLKSVYVDLVAPSVTFDDFFTGYLQGSNPLNEINYTMKPIHVMFGNFIQIISRVLKSFGVNIIDINTFLNSKITHGIFVSDQGGYFNAFYTMYYYILASCGIIGSYIFSFALGIFSSYFYKKSKYDSNIFSQGLYIFWSSNMILGIIRWELIPIWTAVTFVFFYLFNYIFSRKYVVE